MHISTPKVTVTQRVLWVVCLVGWFYASSAPCAIPLEMGVEGVLFRLRLEFELEGLENWGKNSERIRAFNPPAHAKSAIQLHSSDFI